MAIANNQKIDSVRLGDLLSVADQIQAFSLTRKTGAIAVTNQGIQGRIHLVNGEIVDAEFGGKSGLDAAIELINLEDSDSTFTIGQVTERRTIRMATVQLLCEAARYKDEETSRVSNLHNSGQVPSRHFRFLVGEGENAMIFPIRKDIITVGRSVDNDIVIPHTSVSRIHAQVEVLDHSVLLRDMDSSNGTFVSGNRVKEALLRAREKLMFGTVPAMFMSDPASGLV